MRRRSPFPPLLQAASGGTHPLALLATYLFFSLAIGLAWRLDLLIWPAVGLLLFLLLPRPSRQPWLLLLRFLPLLLLVFLLSIIRWQGFAHGHWPWSWQVDNWRQAGLGAMRLAMWIALSARALQDLEPGRFLPPLPRSRRAAAFLLMPTLAFSFLELSLREAFLLERAWLARGGGRQARRRRADWPSLLLPLFRTVFARADTLAESLSIRSFPARWAGAAARPPAWTDLWPLLLALSTLALVLKGGAA